jgi:hypothetical protein
MAPFVPKKKLHGTIFYALSTETNLLVFLHELICYMTSYLICSEFNVFQGVNLILPKFGMKGTRLDF